MSTEQKNELETNALADRMGRGWEQFKQGKLISYRLMALIVVIVAVVGVFFYIRSEQATAASRAWAELETANSVSTLEDFTKKYPSGTAGKIAQLQLARYLLGPDGIDKLRNREEGERKKGVENIEKAREMLAKLVDEFKDDTSLRADCYSGLARAEMALIGVPKDGSTTEYRGSADKAIEWLDKLAEACAGTPWGDDAKKLSESLKTNPKAKDDLTTVQRAAFKQNELPQLPGFGGLPGIPGGSFPSTSGLPGIPGGPLAPSSTPPAAPTPAPVTPPATPPAGTAPIPPTPGGPPAPPPAAPIAPPAAPPTPGTTPMPGTTPPAPPVAPPTTPPAPPVPPKK